MDDFTKIEYAVFCLVFAACAIGYAFLVQLIPNGEHLKYVKKATMGLNETRERRIAEMLRKVSAEMPWVLFYVTVSTFFVGFLLGSL